MVLNKNPGRGWWLVRNELVGRGGKGRVGWIAGEEEE
jgi:hypothetical protein